MTKMLSIENAIKRVFGSVENSPYKDFNTVLGLFDAEKAASQHREAFKKGWLKPLLEQADPEMEQRFIRPFAEDMYKAFSEWAKDETLSEEDRTIWADQNRSVDEWIKDTWSIIMACIEFSLSKPDKEGYYTINMESVAGTISHMFGDNTVVLKAVLENFFDFEEKDKEGKPVEFPVFIYRDLGAGKVIFQTCFMLDDAERTELKSFGGNYPSRLPLRPASERGMGRLFGDELIKSNKGHVNPFNRYDVVTKASEVPVYWDRYVMDELLLDFSYNFAKHPDTPEPNNKAWWQNTVDTWVRRNERIETYYNSLVAAGEADLPMFNGYNTDGRIRLYPMNSIAHHQETEQIKAMTQLKPRPLTREGANAICHAMCNALGYKDDKLVLTDKIDIDDRKKNIRSLTYKQLAKIVHRRELDPRYPDEFALQMTADEPTYALKYLNILKVICDDGKSKKTIGWCIDHYRFDVYPIVVGTTIAQDAKTQGIALWAICFKNKRFMQLCCLTSGHVLADAYNFLMDLWQLPNRAVAKEVNKVPMYGGSNFFHAIKHLKGAKALEKHIRETFSKIDIYGKVQKIAKFWKSEWTTIQLPFPDGSKTLIEPKQKFMVDEKTGEADWGQQLTLNLFDMDINFIIKRRGAVKSSREIAAHINHSIDAFFVAEMYRICWFNPKQKELLWKIREYRHACRTHRHDPRPVHKDRGFSSWKDLEMIRLLDLARKNRFFSFRMLDLLTWDNEYLVPDEILDEMYYELPKDRIDLMTIHDSFVCHVNNADEVRRIYQRIVWRFAKSRIYQELFDAIGLPKEVVQMSEVNLPTLDSMPLVSPKHINDTILEKHFLYKILLSENMLS